MRKAKKDTISCLCFQRTEGAPLVPPLAAHLQKGAPLVPPLAASLQKGAPLVPPLAASLQKGAPLAPPLAARLQKATRDDPLSNSSAKKVTYLSHPLQIRTIRETPLRRVTTV
ncbi:hypothetical protein [Murdochiella massiliensis]|uniref:hypothetical protein n=1 Tax=Murdochiella massiliensis TaxID=1673723 RepID=UPI00082BD268|nr:hypothetical protein [Murdochiella massiliensis]